MLLPVRDIGEADEKAKGLGVLMLNSLSEHPGGWVEEEDLRWAPRLISTGTRLASNGHMDLATVSKRLSETWRAGPGSSREPPLLLLLLLWDPSSSSKMSVFWAVSSGKRPSRTLKIMVVTDCFRRPVATVAAAAATASKLGFPKRVLPYRL